MPEIKASEALKHHQNLIYRRCLEKLQADQPLNEEELSEVTRRNSEDEKKLERAFKKEKKAKGGRPTKITKDLIKRICHHLQEDHATIKDACLAVGISAQTYCVWMANQEAEGIYREFREAVGETLAKVRMWHCKQIKSAAQKGNWNASLMYLKTMDPETWGKAMTENQINVGIQQNTTVVFATMPDNGFNSPDFPAIETNGNGHALLNGVSGNGRDAH